MAGGTPRRERKVVTVVFCDLVGFTSRAESMDPEDVEALLRPVPRARSRGARAPRRHGREVHRRRGDGALRRADRTRGRPRARRPRRARDSRLRASRTGSSCGSGSRPARRSSRSTRSPAEGEGMASGDVVNTAARLQSAAPVNGVLVDETTYRATRHAIDYDERRAGRGEGQAAADPRLEGERARTRDSASTSRTRRAPSSSAASASSRVVRDAFDRARHERTPQLLTLVGVPGIGKSRLVYELSAHRRRRPGAHHVAPGTLPRLRRRRHALGARRDRQGAGRHPRAGHARGGRREAAPTRRATRSPDSDDDAWVESHLLVPSSGSPARRSSAATAGTRPSPPGAASSRGSPSSARSSSSSRTCTGRTRACSTSSTSSSTGSPTSRCSSSAPRGRSCSSGGPAGAAGS